MSFKIIVGSIRCMNRLLLTAFIVLVSCSSPEGDGRMAAKNENDCAESCIESIQRLEYKFVNDFTPQTYTYRSEAIEAYNREFRKIAEDFNQDLDEAAIRKSKLKGKYAENYKDLQKFEKGYEGEIDNDLYLSASKLITANVIPAAVLVSINLIIPPKPDEERIISDLKGHSLSEGFEKKDCFFSEKWRRTIGEQVDVKELHIEDVQNDDNKEYSFTATMVLQEKFLSYSSRVQVYYTLPNGEDWKIDFVKSLGIRVIQTHKYDDCIRCEIDDDGWGGIDALFITNTSEVQLLVLGHFVADKITRNFSQLIPPGEKNQVGGLFGGGSVTDYEIIAVERES